MNEGFWRNEWKRLALCILLLLPAIVFLLYRSLLSPSLSYGLFFAGSFCALLSLAIFLAMVSFYIAPARVIEARSQQTTPDDADTLPAIPRTLDEVHLFDPTEFEVFSAAVVISLGEGHRFLKHCGQSGDQGIDTKLLNTYRLTVVVQSKLYRHDRPIEPTQVRDFQGAIDHEKAVYGFFITTSTFTSASRRWIADTGGRIRTIDGRQLESLLQQRRREIALAYRDIMSDMAGK